MEYYIYIYIYRQDSLAKDFQYGTETNDNIEKKRAVLLSGPPGIGK